ncbi:hypothetical protein HMN09_00003200 [Mycena chlorophos]|uniref:Uncharacterized protein n=1 Tax=Mycena chlorophos TaxID=658473 RepID=A0A8H6TNM6_MYCCL|nr:hypothetical protein HMN09_00003200 [Mycena chlorophos]
MTTPAPASSSSSKKQPKRPPGQNSGTVSNTGADGDPAQPKNARKKFKEKILSVFASKPGTVKNLHPQQEPPPLRGHEGIQSDNQATVALLEQDEVSSAKNPPLETPKAIAAPINEILNDTALANMQIQNMDLKFIGGIGGAGGNPSGHGGQGQGPVVHMPMNIQNANLVNQPSDHFAIMQHLNINTLKDTA